MPNDILEDFLHALEVGIMFKDIEAVRHYLSVYTACEEELEGWIKFLNKK